MLIYYIFIVDWNDLLELQNQLGDIIQAWTDGIDNVLVGIIGFNPETFVSDFLTNIAGLTSQFANLDLGNWQFNTDDWNIDITPDFLEILEIVQEILQNDEGSEAYFINILDQLYVDFEALTGDWIWFNEATGSWEFDISLLNSQTEMEAFLAELEAQLESITLEEMQGWLALDPLQEVFNQLSEQLDVTQITALNEVLAELGLPDLATIVSPGRTNGNYAQQAGVSIQGLMDIILNYATVSQELTGGASIENAVVTATSHDYYAEQKPKNDPRIGM